MEKKLRTSILAALGLLILILDTKTALMGASQGLELCIRTVIPSLLPFFVLSNLLTSGLVGENISLLRPLSQICGVARGAESLLLVGMLGGYPAGAQCVAQAHRDGALKNEDAQRMIAFCNLAGPAFLFGIVAGTFSNPKAAWVLWGIHIFSAFLVAMVLPGRSKENSVLRTGKPLSLSSALQRSLRVMASVCGWIIIFRILVAFLERCALWLLPVPVQVAITGLLELSIGCCSLGRIANDGLRFIISAGMLAFGGLCVCMQTASVASGVKMNTYIWGKLLQVLFSITLASIFQFLLFTNSDQAKIPLILWAAVTASIAAAVKFLHKNQKKSSFSQLVGV